MRFRIYHYRMLSDNRMSRETGELEKNKETSN